MIDKDRLSNAVEAFRQGLEFIDQGKGMLSKSFGDDVLKQFATAILQADDRYQAKAKLGVI